MISIQPLFAKLLNKLIKIKNKIKSSRISVILPAFNEELTIKQCIVAFHKALPEAHIWIINNNSFDDTEFIARATLTKLKCNGGIINEARQGKGNALRRAFYELDSEYYVLCDADLTYPIGLTRELLKPVLDNLADMVVGDRHTLGKYAYKNQRAFHSFGNILVRFLVNRLFKANLVDIMSGFRAFNRKFVKNYPILVGGFEIETDMTLHALDKRLRIIEIPIDYKERPLGSYSKLNTVSDGAKVIFTIFRILRYYKPLIFFGVFALILSLLGLILGFPVILEWLRFDYIKHIPLAILSTGLEIISALLLGIGLILDSIAYHEKALFERENLRSHQK